MQTSVREIVEQYDPHLPLAEAWTIPASWYTDARILELERRTVFGRSWQMIGSADQVRQPGQYITCELAGEPIVLVRGSDGVLRGFFNVCRHHAASVLTQSEGTASSLRCPYHGWTYALDGKLIGTPDFSGVCHFDRADHGLVPVETAVWEKWVFVKLECDGPTLENYLGSDLREQMQELHLERLHWMERRHYLVDCNWKVFVDNYLDGGYHVPHLHKGLNSVLDYRAYAIQSGERYCLQSSPLVSQAADAHTAAVRQGERALYYWIYPNFMVNWYEGVMDTNLVCANGRDQTAVIFDFYFADIAEGVQAHNLASIAVSQRIQEEDVAVCESVQRGLSSRAYRAGRLSPRREAGEHLFHRLLYQDLTTGL